MLVPDVSTLFTTDGQCSVTDWQMVDPGTTTPIDPTSPLYARFQLIEKITGVLSPIKFNTALTHFGWESFLVDIKVTITENSGTGQQEATISLNATSDCLTASAFNFVVQGAMVPRNVISQTATSLTIGVDRANPSGILSFLFDDYLKFSTETANCSVFKVSSFKDEAMQIPTNSSQSIYNQLQTNFLLQTGSFSATDKKTNYKTDMVITTVDPIYMLFETKGVNADGQTLKILLQFNFELCNAPVVPISPSVVTRFIDFTVKTKTLY